MLEGLDDIDWGRLSHAYGTAADVPANIRDLLSSDEHRRNAAFENLFGSIWHQGTIYEATTCALPFLIDILEVSATPDHETVAMLVASIIAGRGYCEVHYARELISPFTRISPPPDLDERLAVERRVVARVRDLGARAIPLLLPYLQHKQRDFRQAVAKILDPSARTRVLD
jgi:hypothetical protein